MITWYGNFTGKLPDKGKFLGWEYDSGLIRSIVTQFEFVWFIIIVNIFFTYAFKTGFKNYDQFLVLIFLWIASAPIAALLYNTFIAKEAINWVLALGITLVFLGAFLVAGNKEILSLLSKS